jgi:hypothetical protein
MTTLKQEPFSLEIGKLIQVKVVAVNRVGNSPESIVGGSAVSAEIPDAPTSLTRDDLLTTTH